MPKKEELRKKDILYLSQSLKSRYKPEFTEHIANQHLFKREMKLKKGEISVYFTKANEALLFEFDGTILPTLQTIRKFPDLLPIITVDAGAVKFMINGADLFRPGMVEWDVFEKDQYVTVVNLQKAAMCIGKTLFSSKELPDKGKVTITIHHLGDPLWFFPKTK